MTSRDSSVAVAASSATYRKATNKLAKAIRISPKHSSYPSGDFEAVTGLIDQKSRGRALKWYKRGIRLGFIEACNALLDGRLEFKNGTLYCPNKFTVSRKMRFRGQAMHELHFKFKAEDLDFK
jgi:hypothetical protein